MIFPPDDFRNDWYGWMTNQMAHALGVGTVGGLALMPFLGPYIAPVAVFVAYFLLWEVWRQKLGAGVADALQDSACVMAGASIICGYEVGYWTAWGAVAVLAVFLLIGVFRRV